MNNEICDKASTKGKLVFIMSSDSRFDEVNNEKLF